jgi:hypothetical protein
LPYLKFHCIPKARTLASLITRKNSKTERKYTRTQGKNRRPAKTSVGYYLESVDTKVPEGTWGGYLSATLPLVTASLYFPQQNLNQNSVQF